MKGGYSVMEELNKEALNEEVVEAEEVLEEVLEEDEQVLDEEIEDVEEMCEAPCCCGEEAPQKEKRCIGCVITAAIMYLSALISIIVGAVNLSDFLGQINMLKEQMGGTLEGVTFTVIVSSMSTAIIPMFLFGLAFIGLGTILLSLSKRK